MSASEYIIAEFPQMDGGASEVVTGKGSSGVNGLWLLASPLRDLYTFM